MRFAYALIALASLPACGGNSGKPDPDGSVAFDLSVAVKPMDAAAPLRDFTLPGDAGLQDFCALPGSYRWTDGGLVVLPGAPKGSTDLSFMKLPTGFCSHYFANVGDARQLRLAPSGELFVASPTGATTGGNSDAGLKAIVVLADDDGDGVADVQNMFLTGIAQTQGMAFAPGFFYYQDRSSINKIPYQPGDRSPRGAAQKVADPSSIYNSALHWPKPIDIADDGTVYFGNGGDQGETCDPRLAPGSRPFHGGILRVDGSPTGAMVAKGFRNPIALRCQRGHNLCFALELAMDYSAQANGREKLILIRPGDDWGFPCCASKTLPYLGIDPVPDCSGVMAEDSGFRIGDTPMGVDFEPGLWPAPYTHSAIIALHGEFGTWVGSRVVAIKMDPATGLPMPSTDITGQSTGAMTDFITGYPLASQSPNTQGRPASVEFSSDGRMYLGNDVNGDIVWIAPIHK